MRRSRLLYLLVGGAMVAAVLLVAIFAPRITTVSPYYFHTLRSAIEGSPPFPPSAEAPLGTDEWGRDIWSRIAFGARWSLLFALLIMGFRLLVALPAAALAAFGPRPFGWMLERAYVYTSAVPPLLVYLLVLSAPGLREIGVLSSAALTVGLLTLLEWARIAVMFRGRMQELAQEPYIEGAIAAGATPTQIFVTHMMPHLWPTLLQTLSAEMGRALLNLAQLGIFGIWVGGGILEEIDISPSGVPKLIVTAGIPEWGTLLASARFYLSSAPWIPLAPAFAFFIGVVGFNLLSQGLEGFAISLAGLRDRISLRLHPSWRAVYAIAVMGGILWYFQGVPWGREAGVAAFAAAQTEALTAHDVDGFVRLILAGETGLQDNRRRWAEQVLQGGHQVVNVRPHGMKLLGAEASGLWSISFGYRDRPPLTITRSIRLVRRWGRWYEAGEDLTPLSGLHVQVEAYYDPTDPARDGMANRFNVNFLASVADHGFERAAALLPGGGKVTEKPIIRYYPSHEAFQQAVIAGGGPDDHGLTSWYDPEHVLHVSPALVHTYDRRRLQASFAAEMMKYLTERYAGGSESLPVLMGRLEITSAGFETYPILNDRFSGVRFYDLPGLFQVDLRALTPRRQQVYAAQSALLVEYLQSQIPAAELTDLILRPGPPLPDRIAHRLGRSPAELAAGYQAHLDQRILGNSVLNLPAGQARIPERLTEAVAARARAYALGEPEFLGFSSGAARTGEQEWFARLRAAGAVRYTASVLDLEQQDGKDLVTVYEQVALADGRTLGAVVVEPWVRQGEGWWLDQGSAWMKVGQ